MALVFGKACEEAVRFIEAGEDDAALEAAANTVSKTMEVPPATASEVILALVFVLVDLAGANCSKKDADASLTTLPLGQEARQAAVQVYMNSREELRALISSCESPYVLPFYSKIRWRMDLEIARRSATFVSTPNVRYLMGLELKDGIGSSSSEETKNILFQSNPATLQQLSRVIDQSLMDLQTSHVKKIRRHIR